MKKSRMPLKFHLDKGCSWFYQEILAEALLVVWICSKISVELAGRFFPEWHTSRIDSQFSMVKWMDPGRMLMGYDSDKCFWYRVISCWISISTDPCANTSFPRYIPNSTSISLGYIGTVSTLCTTAILYISLFCAIIANRHWRLPCFRLVSHIDDAKQELLRELIRESVDSVLAAIKCVLYCVLDFIIRLVSTLLVSAAWLLCVFSPVVITMAVVVRAIILVGGDEVIFPCYVAWAVVLTVYCTGRIWGLWTIDLNRGGLYIIESVLLNKTTRFTGLTMKKHDAQTTSDSNENPASYYSPPRKTGRELLALAESWIGCWALGTAVFPFLCRRHPGLAQLSRWVPVSNCCFRADADKLDRTDARLSYWVDSAELFGNTTNATYFDLPEVSPAAQMIGEVWHTWSGMLAVVTAWPICAFYCFMFLTAIVAVITIIVFICYWSDVTDPHHDLGTRTRTRPKRASGTENTRRAKIPMESPDNNERDDHRVIACMAAMAVLLRYFVIWLVLPCAAAEFFFPEQYQWPGILSIATCCSVWLSYVAILDSRNAWRYCKPVPADSPEQPTEPAAGGSPTTTLIVNNSSSEDAVS